LSFASAAEIALDLSDARKVDGLHPLQPAGSEPSIDFACDVPRNFIHHGARNDDLGVELAKQTHTPDPREVNQRCGVTDRLQGSSDASSSSNSSGLVWIVGMW